MGIYWRHPGRAGMVDDQTAQELLALLSGRAISAPTPRRREPRRQELDMREARLRAAEEEQRLLAKQRELERWLAEEDRKANGGEVLHERVGDVGYVTLSGVIGAEADGGVSDKGFAKALQALGRGLERLVVNINSCGGSVSMGFAMSAALLDYESPTESRAVLASSAATYPALSCDLVKIHQNGRMMIHACSGMTIGPAGAHEETARILRSLDATIAEFYAKRTGNTVGRVRRWMNGGGVYFSPREAVKYGFADEVIPIGPRPRSGDNMRGDRMLPTTREGVAAICRLARGTTAALAARNRTARRR